jgi:hypothetical protein
MALKRKIDPSTGPAQSLINFQLTKLKSEPRYDLVYNMLHHVSNTIAISGVTSGLLAEKSMFWIAKCLRLTPKSDCLQVKQINQKGLSYVFDYFIRREIAIKMA